MRKFLALLLTTISTFVFSQAPTVKLWDYRYGSAFGEELFTFKITADSGFIMGGYTSANSSGGDVTDTARGLNDFWIIKTNSQGIKEWDKRFGGDQNDRATAIIETHDGYLVGGDTESDSTGDMSQYSRGGVDYWIIKIDKAGNKLWDKRYGGTFNDYLTTMISISDGGFLLGGNTFSNFTGDMSHINNGIQDYWLVKIDSSGNKKWDRNYGGMDMEWLSSIIETTDGRYLLGGSTLSDSTGDVSQYSHGGIDYWVVKVDTNSGKQWDKLYGGDAHDWCFAVHPALNGGFLVGGSSFSDSTGDVTQHSRGLADYWFLKITTIGVKQWNKRYGGALNEQVFSNISNTLDGNYLLSGLSYSYMSGDKSEDNLGAEEPWFLKINVAGNKIWDKTVFTSGHEEIGITYQTYDSCFVTALYTSVDTGGYKSQPTQGLLDYWFVKLCDSTFFSSSYNLPFTDINVQIVPNPATDAIIVLPSNSQGLESFNVSIIDITGRVILGKESKNNQKINISHLKAGLYLVKISDGKNSFHKKFLKH